MDRDTAVGLDHHEPRRGGEVGLETTVVVDGALGDDEAHGSSFRDART
jgi:hypothetical protein